MPAREYAYFRRRHDWTPCVSRFLIRMMPLQGGRPMRRRSGCSLVPVWSRFGPGLVPVWSRFGHGLVPIWSRSCHIGPAFFDFNPVCIRSLHLPSPYAARPLPVAEVRCQTKENSLP
jgi:hypothetical protein